MRLLVLGKGKTGALVAEMGRERGHAVTSLGGAENTGACMLTPGYLAKHDAVIDFTTPEAVLLNLRACLATGARVVVGTTGWYADLPTLAALAGEHHAALLYGSNFSIGVQAFFRAARALATALPEYHFTITETHHIAKKDAPSGTALTLQQVVAGTLPPTARVPIKSLREGDVAGLHILEAHSENDVITLRHDALSRRGFAEGAVRAAEWLQDQPAGTYNFADIAGHLT